MEKEVLSLKDCATVGPPSLTEDTSLDRQVLMLSWAFWTLPDGVGKSLMLVAGNPIGVLPSIVEDKYWSVL